MARYDAIVLGAGPSGLAAGIRLAQAGCDVLVLEPHSVWGGLNSFYKKGGRLFDVGLHALTNWAPRGARRGPLPLLLRQLRLRHADLALREQSHSEIVLPGMRLRFSNDFEDLRASVADAFPRRVARFDALVARIREEGLALDEAEPPASARAVLEEALDEPTLADALLLPLCYYGSPREDDCDWDSFRVLFHSIFLEGFARPEGGMRPFWKRLVDRYRSLGGELRLRTGAQRVLTRAGRVVGVETAAGEELRADVVLSSAGRVETLALCGAEVPRPGPDAVGRLSFVESIAVLDRPPAELGHRATVVFFSTSERFAYRRPDGAVDLSSGVIATPNNYAAETPLAEGFLRTTVLANADHWRDLPADEYAERKARVERDVAATTAALVGEHRGHVVFRDTFTPRTIEHFTGHRDGAVYGSPHKARSGRTPVAGLYLIGTDQGFLGIVGAMLSGVLMANEHVLRRRAAHAPAPAPLPR